MGGGDAGHGIGQSRPGGDNRHADFAGRARITIRLVYRALLVAGEDVGDVLLLVNRVINMQHRAARITEDVRNLLLAQCLNDDVCTADVMFFLRHSCFFSLRAGNSTHHIAGRQAAFCRFRRAASGRMTTDDGRNDDIHRIKQDDIAC